MKVGRGGTAVEGGEKVPCKTKTGHYLDVGGESEKSRRAPGLLLMRLKDGGDFSSGVTRCGSAPGDIGAGDIESH